MLRFKTHIGFKTIKILVFLIIFPFFLNAQEVRANIIENNPRFADLFIQAGPFGMNPNRFLTGYETAFYFAPAPTKLQIRGNFKHEISGNLQRDHRESDFVATSNAYTNYKYLEGGVDIILRDKTTKHPSYLTYQIFRPFINPVMQVPSQIRTYWAARTGILNYHRTISAQTDDDGRLGTREGIMLGEEAKDKYMGRIFTGTQTVAASLGLAYSRAKGLLTQLKGADKARNYTRYSIYGDVLYNLNSRADSVNIAGDNFDVAGQSHGGFPLQQLGFRIGGKLTHGKRISLYVKGETGMMPGYQEPKLFWNAGIGISYNLKLFGTVEANPAESLKSPLERRK